MPTLLIPNLVCKVQYMKALTFINLVEIGAIFFELQEAEIGYLTGVIGMHVSPGIVFPAHISLGMRVSLHIYH